LQPLCRYNIVLYPDLGAFEKWSKKADDLRKTGLRIAVSELLEKASWVSEEEKEKGLDIADYLTKLPVSKTDLEKIVEKYPAVDALIRRLQLVPARRVGTSKHPDGT